MISNPPFNPDLQVHAAKPQDRMEAPTLHEICDGFCMSGEGAPPTDFLGYESQ